MRARGGVWALAKLINQLPSKKESRAAIDRLRPTVPLEAKKANWMRCIMRSRSCGGRLSY